MANIKSFIYLDEYKMYSISSQIFEGLTEYIINYTKESKEDKEEQRGPITSGKVLADIISEESGKQEKKFLNDYSYLLFEQELMNTGKVLLASSLEEYKNKVGEYSFIKIKGKAIFNDIESIKNTARNFNDFGQALAHITGFPVFMQLQQEIRNSLADNKDKNMKASIERQLKQSFDVKKIAAEQNLAMDATFLKHLEYLLDFAYKDYFEIQIPYQNELLFTSIIDRQLLREKDDMLIKKYFRNTEKELTVFGIITQCDLVENNQELSGNVEADPTNLKSAIKTLTKAFSGVEKSFVGKLHNEIIIDPIAIYREL